MYKIVNNMCPEYLQELVSCKTHNYNTRGNIKAVNIECPGSHGKNIISTQSPLVLDINLIE